MTNLWSDQESEAAENNPLNLRVYTSRLLGADPSLVLHGGGNTSVKVKEKDIFGKEEDVLYIKGSGWDLATIEKEGFSPVRLKDLIDLATLDSLSDTDMVKYQRMALRDPSAPNPSVEAILHALIPYRFVDHTHADAVVTMSNTPNGAEKIRKLYGNKVLVIPYVMPGFALAREIHRLTAGLDWNSIEGIVLLNHGVFTFHDDARTSYDRMIAIAGMAEDHLNANTRGLKQDRSVPCDKLQLARIRKKASDIHGSPMLVHLDSSCTSTAFSNLPNVADIALRGPLTPDHVIRTKRVPVIISEHAEEDIVRYSDTYLKEFHGLEHDGLTALDPAPRWGIWPTHGTLSFGTGQKQISVIQDISQHTMNAIHRAEQLGGWKTLSVKQLFEMEYWSLEQQKLKKEKKLRPMQGKVVLITGAASGIGRSCVLRAVKEGAAVTALDIDPAVCDIFQEYPQVTGIVCDLTDRQQVQSAVDETIANFGGLDMLISNAGIFPPSCTIAEMDDQIWKKSLEINLTAHQQMLKSCIPFLKVGIDPAIVIIGSKNVPAPGPGAAAYSVAKAGLTQLARIAALELGQHGIRVNVLHPNAVYDTGIWTEDVLKTRADHYGLTVEEYKKNNVLKTEVSSVDVAQMAMTMLSPVFFKTTGAQIPIDGGNDRII